MTAYRIVTAAGNQGPTMFLMKGKAFNRGLTAKFLKDCSASPGSHFVMMVNTFMAIEAWGK